MKKKDSSSWSEIKSLDERLAREPDSFCFARLSGIYLKVGLVADALHTARQGVAKHPGYLAGQRALAMACNANGLHEESRSILQQVTAALPEDADAQKLLANLYVEAGDRASAIRAYSTLLDFRPDDVKSKAHLEELQSSAVDEPVPAEVFTAEVPVESVVTAQHAEDEDDIYELTEDDVVQDEEEDDSFEDEVAQDAPVAAITHSDPLSTQTLAELYEQQGFVDKALNIYRSILEDDPDNEQLQAKISQLELEESAPEIPAAEYDTADAPEESEPFISAPFENITAPAQPSDFPALTQSRADNVLETLDSLLENIRRIKACR